MGYFLGCLGQRVMRRRFDIDRCVDAACDSLDQSVGDKTAKMLGVQPTCAHVADADNAGFPHELQHLVAIGLRHVYDCRHFSVCVNVFTHRLWAAKGSYSRTYSLIKTRVGFVSDDENAAWRGWWAAHSTGHQLVGHIFQVGNPRAGLSTGWVDSAPRPALASPFSAATYAKCLEVASPGIGYPCGYLVAEGPAFSVTYAFRDVPWNRGIPRLFRGARLPAGCSGFSRRLRRRTTLCRSRLELCHKTVSSHGLPKLGQTPSFSPIPVAAIRHWQTAIPNLDAKRRSSAGGLNLRAHRRSGHDGPNRASHPQHASLILVSAVSATSAVVRREAQ